ncbi:MAG: class I SAM-dependent methyltransferase [PS1 clade bacterium]|nr:class I SAM-dependent methyltransferase [PS1 clade bacterium]
MRVVYDKIGDDYDATRKPDPRVRDALADHLALDAAGVYLDVGCGTGNYTAALAALGGCWTGIDPSDQMLSAARAKGPNIRWVRATAERLPFVDARFDAVVSTLALHHMADLSAAFRDIDRVLRPAGRTVIFTATPDQARQCWLAHYFPDMIEKDARGLPSLAQIDAALRDTRLTLSTVTPFFITPDTQDLIFYSGKYRPALYLSPTVRARMSPFRLSVTSSELASGLNQLESDIADGSINQIIAAHESALREYCFVTLDKQA